jgi:inner membrane protein
MDPITQGALGAVLPQATRAKSHGGVAGLFGFISGMATDLDVFIRSSHDPLLYLEYHRHFTHSLVFIPVGGLLAACVLHLLFGRRLKLRFLQSFLFCTLGYATHGLLDAATSYGTLLLWPFSDKRFSWDLISVIDPLFTVPILCLALLSALKGSAAFARAALVWGALYFALAAVQQQAALKMGREIADARGHTPARVEVKPSFGNILVWKTVYEAQGRFFVDAVRVGLSPRVFAGQSIPKLDIARDLPWLDLKSQQAKDIERFRWFSQGYISRDQARPDHVIDIRYSLIPNEVAALWSIKLSRVAAPTDHARFLTHRGNATRRFHDLWRFMFGSDGSPPVP